MGGKFQRFLLLTASWYNYSDRNLYQEAVKSKNLEWKFSFEAVTLEVLVEVVKSLKDASPGYDDLPI